MTSFRCFFALIEVSNGRRRQQTEIGGRLLSVRPARPAQSATRQRPHSRAITRTRVQHGWTLHNTQHAPPLPSHSTGSSASIRIASAPGPAQTQRPQVLVTPAVRPTPLPLDWPCASHAAARACTHEWTHTRRCIAVTRWLTAAAAVQGSAGRRLRLRRGAGRGGAASRRRSARGRRERTQSASSGQLLPESAALPSASVQPPAHAAAHAATQGAGHGSRPHRRLHGRSGARRPGTVRRRCRCRQCVARGHRCCIRAGERS